MPSIEINISGQSYSLKAEEESEEHLREVAELVRRKVESIRKQNPSLSLHKATMMAAFDFASAAIKGRKKSLDYRSTILSRAHQLLDRMQNELNTSQNGTPTT